MIREIIPDCGGQSSERAVTMYRMWHCFDCGLEFTLKSRTRPALCPGCKQLYSGTPEGVKLSKLMDWIYRWAPKKAVKEMERLLGQ